jgi:hypothetical protein
MWRGPLRIDGASKRPALSGETKQVGEAVLFEASVLLLKFFSGPCPLVTSGAG